MCVIVTSQADTMPSLTQLARMSDANPDGAGIAWHDGQRLHRYRNEDNMKTLAFIMDHWQTLETSPFLLHFRLATHGRVCTGNTHPFRFSKGDRTGFIAHNGIAHSFNNKTLLTETLKAACGDPHIRPDEPRLARAVREACAMADRARKHGGPVAQPYALAAWLAWWDGDGKAATLAAIAALDDDPETSLAIMVAAMAASGRYPAYLR